MTDKEALKLAMSSLKELVAQVEGRLFSIKHDHFAMQDARFSIRRLEEALAKQEQAYQQAQRAQLPEAPL